MKFADLLKQNTANTTAAVITLGAAPAGFRTLAQAIADGELVAGDQTTFMVRDDTGNFEFSLFTVTNATTLTRIEVRRSSNGGAAETFGSSTVVFNVPDGEWLSGLASPSAPTVSQVANPEAMMVSVFEGGAPKQIAADDFLVGLTANASEVSDVTPTLAHRVVLLDADGFAYTALVSALQSVLNGGTPPADTTGPTLSSPTGAATGATTASGSVTTNEGNGTLYYLATVNATETAATVKANGATMAINSTGSKAVSASALNSTTQYYWHFVQRDAAGNDSARVTSAPFTTSAAGDTTAPTLSAASGTQTGQTTATGTVSTNEANGTLYRYISTNAVESAATVKAANLTQTVNATGAQNVSATGLTAGTTYYWHFVQRDAAGNESAVISSAGFQTATATPQTNAERWSNVQEFTTYGAMASPQTMGGTAPNHNFSIDFKLTVTNPNDANDYPAATALRFFWISVAAGDAQPDQLPDAVKFTGGAWPGVAPSVNGGGSNSPGANSLGTSGYFHASFPGVFNSTSVFAWGAKGRDYYLVVGFPDGSFKVVPKKIATN